MGDTITVSAGTQQNRVGWSRKREDAAV